MLGREKREEVKGGREGGRIINTEQYRTREELVTSLSGSRTRHQARPGPARETPVKVLKAKAEIDRGERGEIT